MKKYFFLFSIFILAVLYSLLFFIYSKHHQLNILDSSLSSTQIDDKILRQLKKIIPENLFYYNPDFLNKKKSDLGLIFSNNDRIYFDSIINIGNQKGFLTSNEKRNRKISLLFNERKIDAKIKLHGSSISPHIYGNSSYSVSAEDEILGAKKFKIIDENEMNYSIIFIKHLGLLNGLITEDPGKMISVNDGINIKPYHFYEEFNEDYIESKFRMKQAKILKRNVIKVSSNQEWEHSNRLDNLPYNLELSSIDSITFHKFKKLNDYSYDFNDYEKRYLGNFLSLVYFFHNPHQIQGDNDRWVVGDKYILPIYRNEDIILPLINDREYFDQQIFDFQYQMNHNSTYDKFKRFINDNEIRYNRNYNLYQLVKNKLSVIKNFDSIYYSYEDVLKRKSDFYFKLKNTHKAKKEIIENNLKIINSYLETGPTLGIYEDGVLEITSHSYVNIEIIINDQTFNHIPVKFFLEENKIKSKLIPFKKKYSNQLEKILIINKITEDTLDISNNILYVN